MLPKLIFFLTLAHLLILSILWVGFPWPDTRVGAEYVYAGPWVGTQQGNPNIIVNTSIIDTQEAVPLPWEKMRQMEKPRL